VVQQAVDVMEDRPLVDRQVLVVVAELLHRPVGDVLAAVGAFFVVDVEGEGRWNGDAARFVSSIRMK
jgi:hypothetical protein